MGGWAVQPTGTNSPLQLHRGAMTLKVLHAGRDGGTPAPGRNLARGRYYRNVDASLHGVWASQLVATWWSNTLGEVRVRVVRTADVWEYGGREALDIEFMLPSSVTELEDLEFQGGDDEGFQFPALDDEGTGGGSDDDGLGG